jgi:hypothetical protein
MNAIEEERDIVSALTNRLSRPPSSAAKSETKNNPPYRYGILSERKYLVIPRRFGPPLIELPRHKCVSNHPVPWLPSHRRRTRRRRHLIDNEKLRRQVKDVEADEVWSFIAKKEKRVGVDDDLTFGDSYAFVAIERNSRLVLNVTLGKRDQLTANVFLEGVRDAIAPGRFQMTTDGFAPYKHGVPDTFGERVDFAQLIKVYKAAPEGERRYSPAEAASMEVVPVCGNPDFDRICTSIVGAFQLEPSDGASPLHPPHKRIQQKAGESLGGGSTVVYVLQLLPGA